MRSLSGTLEAAQKASSIDALAKIVLTGASTYTYDRDRILDIEHSEELYTYKAEVMLDNSDGALTGLDLKGYEGVISYGAVASGDEYSACAPLWVIGQRLESSQGRLVCILSLVGIPNLMAEDEASESYTPDEDDTETVKDLVNAILGATLDCYDHCQAYGVVWDDENLTTYKPKDGFRIYVGGSRLAALRRLLDYTGLVPRFEADGKIHILKPNISGVDYDYEYSLEAGHAFFSQAYRKRLVIPNYIVVQSREDDDPDYYGYAKDQESMDALAHDDWDGSIRNYYQMVLESDDQAEDIAEAILSKGLLAADGGAADVPMNVGAELFDYNKVTDARENDYRVGNIGYLARHYKPGRGNTPTEWHLTFSFGNWFSALKTRKALKDLETYTDQGSNFQRLWVDDLYAEHITAENIDMYWLDPDGNIDLSKIGDTIDNLGDGEYYARVSTLNMSFDEDPESPTYQKWVIKLDENTFYKSGYNPTDKFDLGGNDLDDINDEDCVYQRTKSSALTADGLVVLDNVYINYSTGQYALLNRTCLQAGYLLLSSVIESADYRTVSDSEKGIWDSAADDADQSLALLSDIAADDKITPVEKLKALQEWEAVVAEKPILDAQADYLEVSRVAYDNAYNGLDTYLNITLNVFGNMSTTTTVSRLMWKGFWNYYFTEKIALVGELSKAGYVYADGAYVIAIDAKNGKITVCNDTDFDGDWYDEGYIEIDADVGITISGMDLILEKGTNKCYIYPSLTCLNIIGDATEDGISIANGPLVMFCDIDPSGPAEHDLGSSSYYYQDIYTEDLYRTYIKDLQHYDDIALIRQMKGDPKRLGFIDKATIHPILLETKERYMSKIKARHERDDQHAKEILREAIAEETRPKKRAKLEETLAKVGSKHQKKLKKAEAEFQPMISMGTEVSLLMGAIKQVADKLDDFGARLGALEGKK